MRSLFTVLSLCLLVLVGWTAPPFPNDSVFKGEGNHLVPVKETSIEIKREVLNMTLRDDRMQVNVHFEFFNPGETRTLTVGFVTPPAYLPNPSGNPIEDFTVTVNGAETKYNIERLGETEFDPGTGSDRTAEADDFVYHFEVEFTPGLNVVTHSYTYGGSHTSPNLESRYPYRLTTGKNWANGEIGEFILNLDMGSEHLFQISHSFEEEAPQSAWTVVGRGKLQPADEQQMLHAFTANDGYLTFQKRNFAPDHDLSIKFQPVRWTHEKLGPIDLTDAPTMKTDTLGRMWEIIARSRPSKEEKIQKLKSFDAAELRLLRNTFFATRGYDFNDEALQAHFEQYLWYVPDPERSASSIDLTEKEKMWIKQLKRLEKEKQRK
jgi:hypothetical protein